MFRPPYRWLYSPSTFFSNLSSCWSDFTHGLSSLWRWLPVIWFDRDWDWCFLARLMEVKLLRMGDVFEKGIHVGCKRDARQVRVCATLLKRLQDDNYLENAMGSKVYHWVLSGTLKEMDQKRNSLPKGSLRRHADHATYMASQDQRYLGYILGKYMRNWWD